MVPLVDNPPPTAQEVIEARYHTHKGKSPGEMGLWTFTREGHRWLLSPASGRWFIHDRLHGTWEPTGFSAGEVVFSVVHTIPVAQRTSSSPGVSDTPVDRAGPGSHVRVSLVCPACNTANGEGSRFCRRCGAGLPSADDMEYCSTCGKPTLPGTSFCRFCGHRIEN